MGIKFKLPANLRALHLHSLKTVNDHQDAIREPGTAAVSWPMRRFESLIPAKLTRKNLTSPGLGPRGATPKQQDTAADAGGLLSSQIGRDLDEAFSMAAKLSRSTCISFAPHGPAPTSVADELRILSGALPVDELNALLAICGSRDLEKHFSPNRMRNENPAIRPRLRASDQVQKIWEDTPEPKAPHQSNLNELFGQSLRGKKFHGRTVVFEKNGRELALKFAKKGEEFTEEWKSLHRAPRLKEALGLQSDLPGIDDTGDTGIFTLSELELPPDIQIALAKEAARGGFELASMADMQVLVYNHPKSHHRYLNDRDPMLTIPELEPASKKALHDLGVCARHGLHHTAIADLFHDFADGRKFRVNINEHHEDKTWYAVNETTTGDLPGWEAAVASVNMRATGVADFKHFKKAEDLPKLKLFREDAEWWDYLNQFAGEHDRPTPLSNPRFAEIYEKSAEFKNIQNSIADRTALIEPLFGWSLSLIDNWCYRRDLIGKGVDEIETFNLPVMLRDGLATFLSAYADADPGLVESKLPLADSPQPSVFSFERFDAQVRFFTDGYVERAEEQPHAAMRKRLVERLAQASSSGNLSDLGLQARQRFIDSANNSLDRFILSLFDGFDNLGGALFGYPEGVRLNILETMDSMLGTGTSEPNSDAEVETDAQPSSLAAQSSVTQKGLFSRWYESYAAKNRPNSLDPQKIIEELEGRETLIAALEKTPYQNLRSLIQSTQTNSTPTPLSPLTDEIIASFPSKEILTERLTIFLQNYTAMKDGEIQREMKRLSEAYDDPQRGKTPAQLMANFSKEISVIRDQVHKAATAEAALAELQIDFSRVRRDAVKENSHPLQEKDPLPGESSTQQIVESIQKFLDEYSTLPDPDDKKAAAKNFVERLDLQSFAGLPLNHANIVRHVFDIDPTGGNPFGRFVFPKELLGFDQQSQIRGDEIPDIMATAAADPIGERPVLGDWKRGLGNTDNRRQASLGQRASAFPFVELAQGLTQFAVACQIMRTQRQS